MSACVAKRWAGMGTTREKPVNDALSNEMKEKMVALQAERAKQDAFLFPQEPINSCNAIVVKESTTVAVPVYDKAKTRGF
jgi:hypothetical protein